MQLLAGLVKDLDDRRSGNARSGASPAKLGPSLRAASYLTAALLMSALTVRALVSCDRSGLVSYYNEIEGDPYAFDDLERSIGDAGLECPEIALERYSGESMRFSPTVEVADPFVARLQRLEAVVVDVATRHYGRAPRRLVNAGAYLCRSVRHRSYRMSEHALGNAIDVVGFDFGPLAKAGDAGREDGGTRPLLALALHRSFSVRVEEHWQSEKAPTAVLHARFLEELARTLIEERVFRSVLGPSHPTHRTHFHLDMAPWSRFRP